MSRLSKKHWLLVGLTILVAVSIGGVLYFHQKSNHQTTNLGQQNEPPINYNPPTEAEKDETIARKNELITGTTSGEQSTSTSKTVTPTIVDAGQYNDSIEVRAFVSSIVESQGKCTFTFTKDAAKVVKTTDASADASTTRCTNLSFNKSELATGTWQLSVSYSSSTSTGSNKTSFEVK